MKVIIKIVFAITCISVDSINLVQFRRNEFTVSPRKANLRVGDFIEGRKGLTNDKGGRNDFINDFLVANGYNASKFSGRRRSDPTDSSSLEDLHWKQAWKERWHQIQDKAFKINITDGGDQVNMVAARPWGIPCGDPNQHDIPWGTCMFAMECEPELRIYRGDYYCGRTRFVCCNLMSNNYDMYHGLIDVSLSGSSLETDSDELKQAKKGNKNKKKKQSKKRRKKIRANRKKEIKKLIKKTIKEISSVLNKTYKYGSRVRAKKTKELKQYIKEMKKKYKKDRQSLKDIHDIELHKVDVKLKKGLYEVRDINREIIFNTTFRKWVVNGTLSKAGAIFLREHYPDLWKELTSIKYTRRNSNRDAEYIEYDIEYGLLY